MYDVIRMHDDITLYETTFKDQNVHLRASAKIFPGGSGATEKNTENYQKIPKNSSLFQGERRATEKKTEK